MNAFTNKLFNPNGLKSNFMHSRLDAIRSFFSTKLLIFTALLCCVLLAGCEENIGNSGNSPYRLTDVREVASSMGLKVDELNTAFVRMSSGTSTVYVYGEPDGRVMVNGIEIAKDINIISDTVTLYIPASVENKLRGALRFDAAMLKKQQAQARLRSRAKPKPVKKKPAILKEKVWLSSGVVLIDPGHGGRDPGAIGKRGTREKHVVLSISRTVAAELSAKGYIVHMTRNTDDFITLDGRVAHAKKVNPDLFVSIHADAAGSSSAKGMTIFVPRRSRNRAKSSRACALVEDSASAVAADSRGVRKHDINLRVLEKTTCPAMLIEVGFLSNGREESRLKSAAYRKKMGRAIARGIHKYLKK